MHSFPQLINRYTSLDRGNDNCTRNTNFRGVHLRANSHLNIQEISILLNATLNTKLESNGRTTFLYFNRVSMASKNNGAISGLGVLTAHFTPGDPTKVVSSTRNAISFPEI